jgi:hypothetical protein
MRVSKEELVAVLAQFNPWWRGEAIADLPKWRRAAFRELHGWMTAPPAPRAVMLSGARQIGKTTLMLQAADALLRAGVPAANILYATFDHPILKLAGIEAVSMPGANANRAPRGRTTCCLTKPSSSATGAPGSSTRSTSARTGASPSPARPCRWWRPTRNLASAAGTRSA